MLILLLVITPVKSLLYEAARPRTHIIMRRHEGESHMKHVDLYPVSWHGNGVREHAVEWTPASATQCTGTTVEYGWRRVVTASLKDILLSHRQHKLHET